MLNHCINVFILHTQFSQITWDTHINRQTTNRHYSHLCSLTHRQTVYIFAQSFGNIRITLLRSH